MNRNCVILLYDTNMCIANMLKQTILNLHNSVLQVLLVGLCGLTNYKRLELLCTFALITVFVDYIIFMSFYPSGKYFYVTSIIKRKEMLIVKPLF